MNIRTNGKMRSLLDVHSTIVKRDEISLPAPLRQMLEDLELDVAEGGVVARTTLRMNADNAQNDPTGVECLLNKVHVDDFVKRGSLSLKELTQVGILYALAVKDKLERTRIPGMFRVIVSVSSTSIASLPHSCTVRFHRLREDNPWLKEDIESYEDEALLTIDWANVA
jgi:hypothetical protein